MVILRHSKVDVGLVGLSVVDGGIVEAHNLAIMCLDALNLVIGRVQGRIGI